MSYLINLTPHELRIHYAEKVLVLPPSGEVARVGTVRTSTFSMAEGIPLSFYKYTEITGLPDPDGKSTFIVSGMVESAAGPGRLDVVAPGNLIRNEMGKPIGCEGLKKSL